jgi:hypothetical protein
MTRRRLGTAAISTVVFAVIVAALCVATELAARHEHMFATRRDRVIAVEPFTSPRLWSPPTPSAQTQQPPPAPAPVRIEPPPPPPVPSDATITIIRNLRGIDYRYRGDTDCWGHVRCPPDSEQFGPAALQRPHLPKCAFPAVDCVLIPSDR